MTTVRDSDSGLAPLARPGMTAGFNTAENAAARELTVAPYCGASPMRVIIFFHCATSRRK